MVKKQRYTRPDAIVRRRAAAHLDYEFELWAKTANAMISLHGNPHLDPVLGLACLESYLIHSRVLLAAFNHDRKHPKDMLVRDFLDERIWPRIGKRFRLTKPMTKVMDNVSKFVAHLSYERADRRRRPKWTPSQYQWIHDRLYVFYDALDDRAKRLFPKLQAALGR